MYNPLNPLAKRIIDNHLYTVTNTTVEGYIQYWKTNQSDDLEDAALHLLDRVYAQSGDFAFDLEDKEDLAQALVEIFKKNQLFAPNVLTSP